MEATKRVNTIIEPAGRIVIEPPLSEVRTKFVVARPEMPGQLYVTSCKIGNVSVMDGECDLFTFAAPYDVPAGCRVSLSLRSNWSAQLVVTTHVARAPADDRSVLARHVGAAPRT